MTAKDDPESKPTSVRLPEDTKKRLLALSSRDVSQSDIINLALQELYQALDAGAKLEIPPRAITLTRPKAGLSTAQKDEARQKGVAAAKRDAEIHQG
mgnify:CR=1 FL=1